MGNEFSIGTIYIRILSITPLSDLIRYRRFAHLLDSRLILSLTLSLSSEYVSNTQVVAIVHKPEYNKKICKEFASQFPAAYSNPTETMSVKACDLHPINSIFEARPYHKICRYCTTITFNDITKITLAFRDPIALVNKTDQYHKNRIFRWRRRRRATQFYWVKSISLYFK